MKEPGKIDIVIDFAGPLAKEYGNGRMAVDLPVEEFMVPLSAMVKAAEAARLCSADQVRR